MFINQQNKSRNSKFLILVIFSILAVLVATLYPFNFALPDSISKRELVNSFDNNSFFSDQVNNVLLFLPFGFGLTGLLQRNKTKLILQIVAVTLASAALSSTVELLQIMVPSRTPTPADIFNNSFGGFLGLICFYIWNSQSFKAILQRIESSKASNSISKDRTIARLKDLVDIAKNLSGATSIEEIFSQVQQVVFRYLSSIDRLGLLIDVHDCNKLALINAASRDVNNKQQLMENDSWISQSICQQVFDEKVAIQSADTHQDERFKEEHSVFLKGIRSAMAVPLWDENKVVGVLYADASFSSYHWVKEGSEDLSFFSTLGNLVSSSVQRWLLIEKLKSEEVIRPCSHP
ncbi:MAG: VanZ family protein, partial [Cyanobacteria bacterium J06636_27]